MDTLKSIFDRVMGAENISLKEISANIINNYYKRLYTGKEHEEISLMYFDQVHMQLIFWLGSNKQYLKSEQLNNFLSITLLKAKINTYNRRRNIYQTWLGGQENYSGNNRLLKMLFKLYHNASHYKEVKKELDLIKPITELEKQLKKEK